MKRYFILTFILLSAFVLNLFAEDKKLLTVSDIFVSQKFHGKTLNHAKWFPDGKSFTFIKNDDQSNFPSLYKHEVKSGDVSKLLDGAEIINPQTGDTILFSDYEWSESGKKLLLKADSRRVWRRFSLAHFYVYDLDQKKLQAVSGGNERILHAKLSPDASKVGYVYENNLFIKDFKTDSVQQLTKDGSETIINGQFDWVYEEEFGIANGWRWSPDGNKIAFWRLDQSMEPEFSWIDYQPLHGAVKTIRYPKAGANNALVKIGVIHLQSGKTVWMDIGAESDIYIPRIQWTNNPNKLSIQRLNRLQNKLDLLIADAKSGQSKLVLSETDPCWVDYLDNIEFLNNKKQFVWTSERDGFQHIYLYNMDGSLERQLTKGKWEVGNVYGVNENKRLVYFSANKVNITESHIYSIKLNGKSLKRLTKKKGRHRANFSPDWESFIHTFSNSHTPAQYSLFSDTGINIRTLEENKIEALDEYDISYPQFLTFDTEDGVTLNAMIIKPTDFDKNKKYPVLIFGYGGPGSQMVRNGWGRSNLLWHNLLAQKGYIIFSLDNRGTGGRGKAFKNLAYGDIGKWMIFDHIEGAKYLAKLPYVDKERIGIWGWSGGGYLTLMALTKGSDYFKAGIAVASVSDFRFYDSIWTERYMGLPQDNAAGYDSTSALNYVDKYKGNLLIIHGAADDNVHAQNSMQFIEKMQSANKQFDLMLYPGKSHSLLGRNTRLHLYTLMTDFILKKL